MRKDVLLEHPADGDVRKLHGQHSTDLGTGKDKKMEDRPANTQQPLAELKLNVKKLEIEHAQELMSQPTGAAWITRKISSGRAVKSHSKGIQMEPQNKPS